METNGSFGSLGGSGSSITNIPQAPLSAQTGEFNRKRAYGNASGGWLAFIAMTAFIILLLVLGNAAG